jgi:transglutaminase-like putative cysteine protease
MEFCIHHVTRFRYRSEVSESVMELRLHPRCEGAQECVDFSLTIEPAACQFEHQDYLGNIIHSFDIPGGHRQLTITARSRLQMGPPLRLPERLHPEAWDALETEIAHGDYYEALAPSPFAEPSPLLLDLARAWDVRRRGDPLSLLREINTRIYRSFRYVPQATRVDSTIDHALSIGQGVCQDFTHIMLALARHARIPCRYVSGYLFHRGKEVYRADQDRADPDRADSDRPDPDRADPDRADPDRAAEDAMHAWVEAWLPGLGWVGFDPTNNTLAAERHIRVAVGRDYTDVPPTRGVFKGDGDSELSVAVQVYLAGVEPPAPRLIRVQNWTRGAVGDWDWAQVQSAQQQ